MNTLNRRQPSGMLGFSIYGRANGMMSLGGIVGVGAGAGVALMFVLAGMLFRVVRDAESILPDHDQPA